MFRGDAAPNAVYWRASRPQWRRRRSGGHMPPASSHGAPVREHASAFRPPTSAAYVQSSIPFLEFAWQGRTDWRGHMQVLALISVYAPVVIIILAVIAVLFSFFWVFLPLPRWMSTAMGRLLVRFWRWRERRR